MAQNPVVEWVSEHPKTALGIALAAGVAVGLSPKARKGLVEMMNKAASFMS
jgi:hypothetical protein